MQNVFGCGCLVLLTGIALCEITDNKGPTFVSEPPDVVDFSNGTGARVDCLARGVPSPSVQWIRLDGSSVTAVPRLLTVLSNGSLVFLPFGAEQYRQDIHASVYKCVATNTVGSIVSRNVKVRGVVKQFYEVQVYDEFVIMGNTAVLKCHVPSFVRDYVVVTAWIQDESVVLTRLNQLENDHFTISKNGDLYIREVNMNDQAMKYRCKTMHRLTGDSRLSPPGHLIVTDPHSSVPPRITHNLPFIQGRQRETLEVFCVAQAHPVPTYRWYKLIDKQTLLLKNNGAGRLRPQGNMLVIKDATVDDGGLYACVVNNSVGEEKVETTITITAELSAKVQPQHQVANVGSAAVLNCVIYGHPVQTVTWLKDRQSIVPNQKYEFISKEILRINNVSREDRGMYQCVIANDERMAQGVAEIILGDALPEFRATFSEMTVKQSSDFALKCEVSSNPPLHVTWFLDDMELRTWNHRRYNVHAYTTILGDVVSLLNVTDTRVEDGGVYTCTASNRVGNASSQAKINVWGPPYIRPMENTTIIAGATVVLKCPVTGYPIQSITWERDNRVLPINLRQTVLPNGTFVLTSAEKSDAGHYACMAQNELGQRDKKSTRLAVIVPPKIDPFEFPRETREGFRGRVLCSVVDGDSPIQITWLKDNQPVPTDILDIVIQKTDDFSSMITFKAINKRHNGNYSCVASNSAGRVNHTAQLQVQVPPFWINEPKDSEVLLSKTTMLHCQAGGFPNPTLQWMKSKGKTPGSFLDMRGYGSRHHLFPNGSFSITNAEKGDEGYYLCQADNGIGSGQSKVIYLQVNVPAYFETMDSNATVRVGQDGILKCKANGDKPMEIRWSRNGKSIGQDNNDKFSVRFHQLDDGLLSELSIKQTSRDDAAVFQCYATNAHGHDEATVHLAVQEQPEQPSNLVVVNVSGRNVTTSWKAPFDGNAPITAYIIQHKRIMDSWDVNSVNFTVPGSESTFTIGSLVPGTPYHLRHYARNSMGISKASDTVDATTLEEEPQGSPLAVEAKATSSESVKIAWKPPKREFWNGMILGYYIGFRIYDSNEPYKYKTIDMNPSSDTMEYHLTHLRKYTKYSIVVNAFNRMGKGPPSDEVIAVTSEDAPDEAPVDVSCVPLSSQSVQVNWSPPPTSTQNGQILGYKIFYRLVSDWEDNDELHVTTASTSRVNLHTLQKYSNYSVQVLAFTRIGAGIRSFPVFCRTQEDVPGPPAAIKALVKTSESILVTWLPPQHPNGNLIKYTIYMRSSNDRQPFQHTVKHISSTTYDLLYEARALKEKENYEFWITASTVIGEGESTKVIKQTPQAKIVAQIASFSDELVLRWKESVTMSCRTVGNPTPVRRWSVRGNIITENSKMSISPDGSLEISDLLYGDMENYTCDVENIYGKDSVTYSLIVQAPPVSPSVILVGSTASSLQLKIVPPKIVRGKVKGYTLTYKRDYSEWEEIEIDKNDDVITLENLRCGTLYHVYMTAYNWVGAGEPSDILPVSTRGGAPKVKKLSDAITANITCVTLHLRYWPDGGCPINYYVLKYRHVDDKDWMLVSNNIQPQQGDIVLSDLYPATWYEVEVTAHNAAGLNTAQYTMATLAPDGVTIAPNTASNTDYSRKTMELNWNLIAAVVTAIGTVLTVLTLAICLLIRRRKYRGYHSSYGTPAANAKMPINSHMELSSGNAPHSIELKLTPTPQKKCLRDLANTQQIGIQDSVTDPYAFYKLSQNRKEAPTTNQCFENVPHRNHGISPQNPACHPRARRRMTQLTNLTTEVPAVPIDNELQSVVNPSVPYQGGGGDSGHILIFRSEYDSDNSDTGGEYYTESAAQLSDRCRGNLPDLLFHGTDSSSSAPNEETSSEEEEEGNSNHQLRQRLNRGSLHQDPLMNRFQMQTEDISMYLHDYTNSVNFTDTNELSEAECDRDLNWRSRQDTRPNTTSMQSMVNVATVVSSGYEV